MNVLWFTGRRFDNFCSTTQSSLATGIIGKGHSVHILNPDEQGSHSDKKWKHTGFSMSSIPGLQSRKLSRDMKTWIQQNEFDDDTVGVGEDATAAQNAGPGLPAARPPSMFFFAEPSPSLAAFWEAPHTNRL